MEKLEEKRNALFFHCSLLQLRKMHLQRVNNGRSVHRRETIKTKRMKREGENMIEKRWNAIARTIFGRARNWCACRASSLGSSVIVALLSRQERARPSNSIRWNCATRPHNSRGTSVYRHRSRASFRHVSRSLSFHVSRYLSILTLLPSHFFRAITCSVFPLHALQIETEEKKRRRRDISNASFNSRTWIFPSFRE